LNSLLLFKDQDKNPIGNTFPDTLGFELTMLYSKPGDISLVVGDGVGQLTLGGYMAGRDMRMVEWSEDMVERATARILHSEFATKFGLAANL
jgi:hypothetical protein